MSNIYKLILPFSACLILTINTVAQQPVLRHYTVEDGLPSSLIYQIIEDKEGFIWIGTDRGVARFNGYEFEQFTVKDGLPSNDVWSFEIDTTGRIWMATFNKPSYFENEKFHTLDLSKDFPKIGKVEFYSIDEKGNRYFNTSSQHLIQIEENDSLNIFKKRAFTFITEDSAGQKWFMTRHKKGEFNEPLSLVIFKKNKNHELQRVSEVKTVSLSDYVFPHTIVRQKDIVLFSKFNYYVFDYKTIKEYPLQRILGVPTEITAVLKIGESKTLIRTKKDFFIIDQDLNVLPNYEFLNNYSLNRIFEDSNNNLWLCTSDDGVYFLSNNARKSQSFQPSEKLTDNEILCLTKDDKNQIWMGTSKGQLFSFQDGTLNEFVISSRTLQTNRILDLEFNARKLYVGGDNGLYVILPEDLQKGELKAKKFFGKYNSRPFIPNDFNLILNSVKTICISPEHTVFGGTRSSLFQVTPNQDGYQFKSLRHREVPIYALEIDHSQNLWVGKKNGIDIYKNDTLISMRERHALFSRPVNDLKIDSKNHLWVATDGFGLFRYKNEKIDTIHSVEKEQVKNIFIDQKNQIWTATNRGIRKIIVTREVPFEYDFLKITTAHGLASSETNCVFVDENQIFVGTKHGLTILGNEAISESSKSPSLLFSKITINGKTVATQDTFYLSHLERNINIEYVCLSYKSTKNIDYWYKMEGIDSTWQQTTDLKKEYPTLSAKNYTFHLKARDIDGITTSEKSITFIIQPPWWQTSWFIGLGSILSILSIALFIRWQVKIYQKRSENETEINKKFAELELEALQAQMNPHFVFNAMQSIQNFIFQKDERTANRYMVKFSRLMRLFLESSRSKYIAFEDELKLIRFYVELENMRFPDKFDFEIKTDGFFESESVRIPSMLIQPFVENAINHGLIQKEKMGHLLIEMSMDNGQFLCIVDDDGVGRKKAREFRAQSFKHHKSRGMQIVEERQRVMNLIGETAINIKIIDKKDNQNQPEGTRIEIRFDLKK